MHVLFVWLTLVVVFWLILLAGWPLVPPRVPHTPQLQHQAGSVQLLVICQDLGYKPCRHLALALQKRAGPCRHEQPSGRLSLFRIRLHQSDSKPSYRAELLRVQASEEPGKVGLRCLDQPIDTTMPVGKLVFTILAAVAEFERALIIERTQQGLAAVRARGNLEGRPKSYAPETATAVLALQAAGQSMTDIATVCKISRRTAYRIVEDAATVV